MNKNRTESISITTSKCESISPVTSHDHPSAYCYFGSPDGLHRASLHDALDQFRIALELRGPLTVDDAAWLAPELAKIIMDALA